MNEPTPRTGSAEQSRRVASLWSQPLVSRLAVATGAAVAPLAVTEYLIRRLFAGSTLLDFVPSYPNDETGYWHQIATFAEAGFDGGYYTYGEDQALASFSHFGPHGPLYPMIYGAVAWLTGWHPWSPIVFNGVALTLAMVAFFALTRLRTLDMLLVAGVVLTSFAVMIYVPSAMQETLHHAIAFVLAGLLCRIAGSGGRTHRFLALFVFAVAVASLLRPLWAIALAPALLLGLRMPPRRRIPATAAITTFAVAASWYGWRAISAPVPGARLQVAGGAGEVTTTPLWDNAAENLRHLATGFADVFHAPALLLTTYLTMLVFGACVAMLARAGIGLRRGKPVAGALTVELTGAIVLFGVLLATIVFYLDVAMGFNRVLMPFLLLVLLVAVGLRRRRWLLLAVVIVNVAFLPKLLDAYQIVRWSSFSYNREDLANVRAAFDAHVSFERGASGWCNTLLTSEYTLQLVALPAGVGISSTYGGSPPAFPKSKYILIGGNWPKGELPKARLRQLAKLSFGTLYLNEAARCS